MNRRPEPPRLAGMIATDDRLLPDVQEVEIPDASHVMHVANPDATASAVIRFLAGTTTSRSRSLS